jgi:hypothetical protein
VVAGETTGSLGGSNAGEFDAFVRKYAPAGIELWTRQFGTASSDFARSVAVDAAGNVLVAGSTLGSLAGPSAGNTDAYVRKYSAAGAELWTRQFGGADCDESTALAVDAAGNVVVAGVTCVRESGPEAPVWSHAFVRKYSPAGVEVWTRQFVLEGTASAWAVAVDGTGNVLVAGQTACIDRDCDLSPNGFVRKYTPAGGEVWTRFFVTETNDYVWGVAADTAGNVLVAGSTEGSLDGPKSVILGTNSFVRKLDPAGNKLWGRQFAAVSSYYVAGVAVDPAGNVLVPTRATDDPQDPHIPVIRKLDGNGNTLWSSAQPASHNSWIGLGVDPAGNALVTGTTIKSLYGPNAGNADVFLLSLTPAGK